MHRGLRRIIGITLLLTTGCAINLAKRSPWDIQQLAELSDQLEQFKTLVRLKAEEANELRKAKELLEQRLSSSEVSVGYDERGLVARMVDRVLFDSGKAELRSRTVSALDEVAGVVRQFPDQPVGIEGHTDDQPIKHSGWADNKALSLARPGDLVMVTGKGSEEVMVVKGGKKVPFSDRAVVRELTSPARSTSDPSLLKEG